MRTIHVLRKPCSEGTVAANVLKCGTGALNVDACRIASDGTHGSAKSAGQGAGHGAHEGHGVYHGVGGLITPPHPQGRWPANVILEEGSVSEALDRQSGILKSAVAVEVKTSPVHGQFVSNARTVPGVNQHGGEGGASRFFQHVKIKVKE